MTRPVAQQSLSLGQWSTRGSPHHSQVKLQIEEDHGSKNCQKFGQAPGQDQLPWSPPGKSSTITN